MDVGVEEKNRGTDPEGENRVGLQGCGACDEAYYGERRTDRGGCAYPQTRRTRLGASRWRKL